MGWTHVPYSRRAEIIAQNTKGWERANDDGTVVKSECLAHCFRGSAFAGTLWAVWENTVRKDGVIVKQDRWIGCDLLQYWRSRDHGNGWAWKDQCETMGPNAVTCPLGYLDMVPPRPHSDKDDSDKWANDWRVRVIEYHAQQKEKREARKAALV